MSYNIAIDGPAGAGKSTIAKRLANRLGFVYVDTGAMYRAMALYFIRHEIPASDEKAITSGCEKMEITIAYEDGIQQVYLNGENVTSQIRAEEVGKMASATSGYAAVRAKLLQLQREVAAREDVVMDGRDIGTCVLPDAQTKIYLTASTLTRAKRRYKELIEKGEACSLEEIEKDIADRDYRDSHREIAPLKQAETAVFVDSSQMTIDQVIDTIVKAACDRGLTVR